MRLSWLRTQKSAFSDWTWTESILKHDYLNFRESNQEDLHKGRQFLEEFAKTKQITSEEQWKLVKSKDFLAFNKREGRKFIRKYHSPLESLLILFPEKKWNLIEWNNFPRNFWDKKSNQLEYLKNMVDYFKITKKSDWERVNNKAVLKLKGGSSFLHKYNTIAEIMSQFIKDSNSLKIVNRKQNKELFRKALEFYLKERGYSVFPDDFYKIKRKELEGNERTKEIIKKYKSVAELFLHLFPEYSIEKGKFNQKTENKPVKNESDRVEKNFWKDKKNHRNFLDFLGKNHFKLDKVEDWAQVKLEDFYQCKKAAGLLQFYPSFFDLIQENYPEHKFNPFQFHSKPKNIWKSRENQLLYFEELKKKLKIQNYDEFYSINLRVHGGYNLLREYDFSYFRLFSTLFPDYPWDKEKAEKRQPWDDLAFQREYMDKIATQLGFYDTKLVEGKSLHSNQLENQNLQAHLSLSPLIKWNKVKVADFKKFPHAKTLLSKYKSFFDMLKAVYPEINWIPFERSQIPYNYWNDDNNILSFVEDLKKQYFIKETADWSRLSIKQVTKSGGGRLLRRFGNLYNILTYIYPNEKFNPAHFAHRDKRSTQKLLFNIIHQLYPDEEILEEYAHPDLSRMSGFAVTFDIFLPTMKVAFEYQGEHHFIEFPAFGSLELYQTRDNEKAKLASENGINLFVIPYWWDMESTSIRKTIELGYYPYTLESSKKQCK